MKTKLLSKRNFITLVVAILAVSTLSARDWYVKSNATGEGTSWDDAANVSILNNTATSGGSTLSDGDVVYMAAGKYIRTTTISLTKYVSINGGYPATSTGTSLPTRNLATDSTLFVAGNGTAKGLNINATTLTTGKIVLDGLNFENFTATGSSATALNITSSQANIEFKNVGFKNNVSTNANGGALYMASFANDITISFDNCNFIGNQANVTPTIANGYGGAAFFNNGSTAKTIKFTNCNFINNSAYGRAGALYFTSSITCEITDCNFDTNYCTNTTNDASSGGCIYAASGANGANNVTILRSIFLNSSCTSKGSVIYFNTTPKSTLTITNSSLIGNYAKRSNASRAAIDVDNYSTTLDVIMQNCVLSNYNNNTSGVKQSNKADLMMVSAANSSLSSTFANSILNGVHFSSSNTYDATTPTVLYGTTGFLDESSIALALSGDLKITNNIVLKKTFIAAEAGTYAPTKIFDVKRLTGKAMTLNANIPVGYKLTVDNIDYSAGEKTISIPVSISDPVIILAVDGTTGTKVNEASKYNLTSANGLISISGLSAGEVVAVYNANGQLLSKQTANSSTVQMPAKGFVIVKINSTVSKILVK